MTTPENNSNNEVEPTPQIPEARTSTLMGARMKLGVAFVLVAAALAYFAFTAFEGATVNYLTVAEAASEKPTEVDRMIGVSGKLVKDSYVRDADGVTAHFSLKDEDGSQHLDVSYKGEIGQIFFNDHSEIILQGQKLEDGSFSAENLTVRCPSKYLTEAEQAELDAQNSGDPSAPPYQPDYFDKEA